MRKIKYYFLPLLVISLILIGQTQVKADIILFQDNFNSENGGVANDSTLNFNSFTNWAVTDGTVDLIGNSYFDFHPGNGLYVDLDGSTNNAGVLTTKNAFDLQTGNKYILEFDLGRSQNYLGDNTVLVSVKLSGFATIIFTITDQAPLTHYSLDYEPLLTGGSAKIEFSNIGGDNIGAVLDNVKLTQVPEPSILLLLGSSLIGLVGLRRKFKK